MDGVFYSVATPIGNLADITLRACDVLRSVDLILCEDTRNTSVLAEKYNFTAPLKSYHKFNETERSVEILDFIKNGKNVALVTDAGTPCISDPGSILIEQLLQNGIKVVPISGACAVVTFLSALPREKEEFTFIGFLPRKNGELKEIFEKYNFSNTVFYESPKRLVDTLQVLTEFCPNKKLAIGRELTKKFEEIMVDTAQNLLEYFSKNPPKGEIVGMLYATLQENNFNEQEIVLQINKLKAQKFSNKDIATILSTLFDVKKNDIYSLCIR